MPSVEVLVGMIASGKSTYARNRADEGAVVVSHDSLTEMLHARYRYEQGLRAFYRGIEESIVRYALTIGKDVVIDRTHLTLESRRRWIDWIDSAMWLPKVPVVAIVFPREIAYVHARRRYEHDHRGRPFHEWLKVVLHHQEQADKEPISDDEGFDEIIRVSGKEDS